MRTINEGDLVEFQWIIPNEPRRYIVGRVLSTPSDVGDMWYIETLNSEMLAINPSCTYLVDIRVIEKRT